MDQQEPHLESVDPPPELARAHEPVAAGERLEIIDVLRGFALLGILFVNMQFYTTPLAMFMVPEAYWPEAHNAWATFFIHFFAQGKFYTLFSFLFGLGISIQLLRAEERGQSFLGYHYRRMIVLLGIGLAHAFFIWMGDILVTYAVLGLVLPLFLRCQPRTLLIWAGAILLVMSFLLAAGACGTAVYSSLTGETRSEGPSADDLKETKEAANREKRIYGRGDYLASTALRARQTLSAWMLILFTQGPHSFALFLLGLYAGKTRWFHDLPATLSWFRRAWWFGLIVGLGGMVVTYYCFTRSDISSWGGFSWKLAGGSLSLITGPALSCFYACSIVLLYQLPIVRRMLSPVSAVGQMALTNYLAQSVICNLLFYGSTIVFGLGFGYYGELGPAVGLGLTVAIWLVELVWSILWLRVLRMRFGPMEWLWRTLTYGRVQPMR
jgi:uncharacterized protein